MTIPEQADLTRLGDALEHSTRQAFRPIGSAVVAIHKAIGGSEARYVVAAVEPAEHRKASGTFAIFTDALVARVTFESMPSANRLADNRMGPLRIEVAPRASLVGVAISTPEISLPWDRTAEGFGETHWDTSATLAYAGWEQRISVSANGPIDFDAFYASILGDLLRGQTDAG